MKLAVLVSGEGTNLQAILDARASGGLTATSIVCVASSRPGAPALSRATDAGIPALTHRPADYPDRRAHDVALASLLLAHGADAVALAGYLRVLTPAFLDAFPSRVVNVHPALLPSFPGLHAVEQALAAGVRVSGATVHLVDAGVDTGPILLQEAVPVEPDDDVAALSARIRTVEHRLLPRALSLLALGRIHIAGRRALVERA